MLIDLENILPTSEIAQDFTNHLRDIRELHKMCVAKELGDFNSVIDNYTASFFNLYEKYQLSMTLKVHVIVHHYKYYFEKTGVTLRDTNGEFTETCHSSLRISEERHGFKIVKKLVHLFINKKPSKVTLSSTQQELASVHQ